MNEKAKPKVNSEGHKELDRVQQQFDAFDSDVKQMTQDNLNKAPKLDVEPQTKIAQKDLEKTNDVYLKPKRAIGSREKFNEDYREDYNFAKEYVRFIAENREIGGEDITLWTKPFAGLPAEEWVVPVNKPVWGPRYLAEQIKKCCYHRLIMQQNVITEANSIGQMYGALAADTTIQRLDALPVSTRKSIFMGANF